MKKTIQIINQDRSSAMRGMVMQLTGFTDDQMNAMIFDVAVLYMKGMEMGEEWLTIWLKEPLFWAWWRQQWMLIDEVFWNRYSANIGHDEVQMELRQRYEKLHMTIDKFPDEIVYEKIHSDYEITGRQILQKIRSKNNI